MFNINVDAPKNLQADEVFVVKSTLVNNSDNSWEVEHGAGMFTYYVYDTNGEHVLQDIEQRRVNAIGIAVILKAE